MVKKEWPMSTLVIGVTGRRGSGKSTFCRHVEEILGEVIWVTFAEPIKRFCVDVLGIPESVVYGEDSVKSEWSTEIHWPDSQMCMTAREVMQYFGTDLMREWIPDVWVRAARLAIDRAESSVVVVQDVRFSNELEMLRELPSDRYSVKLVRLKRVAPGTERDSHLSENALHAVPDDCFDLIVPADVGSVADQKQYTEPSIRGWWKELGCV
jgi:energy-coupling factor transporter ATP-binding protein EcfA2